ncbi:MAG: hypothetical protein ABIN67_08470 [Ferruginibacter sp.]
MRHSIISMAGIFLAASTLFLACKKEDTDKLQIFRGAEMPMGNGKANSWFTTNENGVPQEIGFEMTSEAFTGLTTDPADFAAATFALQQHPKAKDLTPFDHLVINWNPHGHDPAGVFDIPHFDFHLYTITAEDRVTIPPYMPATAALHDKLPPAGFMPASFTATPGGVPQMGKHWGDNNMSLPFKHTMVYGSYNGKMVFLEPMVTKVFLDSGEKVTHDYDQPTQFEKTGKYYPTKYNIYRDASNHKHYVTLSAFVLR